MQKKTKETYQSPSARRLEVKTHYVMCVSNNENPFGGSEQDI